MLGQVLAGNAFTESAAQQNIQDPLGGYDVLIADRGNNRVIEMTPSKNIIWHYHFHLPVQSLGADDAFFADGGRTVMMTMEYDQIIEQVDYATKKVIWRYGSPGVPGSWPGYLRTPDDAYKLSNGDVTVAEARQQVRGDGGVCLGELVVGLGQAVGVERLDLLGVVAELADAEDDEDRATHPADRRRPARRRAGAASWPRRLARAAA